MCIFARLRAWASGGRRGRAFAGPACAAAWDLSTKSCLGQLLRTVSRERCCWCQGLLDTKNLLCFVGVNFVIYNLIRRRLCGQPELELVDGPEIGVEVVVDVVQHRPRGDAAQCRLLVVDVVAAPAFRRYRGITTRKRRHRFCSSETIALLDSRSYLIRSSSVKLASTAARADVSRTSLNKPTFQPPKLRSAIVSTVGVPSSVTGGVKWLMPPRLTCVSIIFPSGLMS